MSLWSASGSPKAFGFDLSKNLRSRSSASLELVITLRSLVYSICKGQLMCLLVEERQLRGNTPTRWKSFLHQREGPIPPHSLYSNEYHLFFLYISSLFYHCVQKNNYLGKNLSPAISLQEKIKGNGRFVLVWTIPFHIS